MENTNNKTAATVNTLENLITILEDGKLGYTNAAENVDCKDTKTEFLGFARERALYIVELQDEINRLGKSTDAEGGAAGALHRTWIDIKSLFTGGDKESIINSCITGEKAAIDEYETTLKEDHWSSAERIILMKQLAGIQTALAKIEIRKNVSV